jgi:hypothetical protein
MSITVTAEDIPKITLRILQNKYSQECENYLSKINELM